MTPNDEYSCRTAPLTSKRYILYIYSTNTCTEYFKHCIYFPFFPLQNAVCFIKLTYLVPVLFTFYIQDVLKFKKIIPAPNFKILMYMILSYVWLVLICVCVCVCVIWSCLERNGFVFLSIDLEVFGEFVFKEI